MDIFERVTEFSRPRLGKQILASLLSIGLLFATWPQNLSANQTAQATAQTAQAPPYAQQTPERPEATEPLLHPVFSAVTFPAGTPDSHRRFGCVALQNSYCNSIRREAPTWA
jgi:hypothetical protein